jgi:hypothetical protein
MLPSQNQSYLYSADPGALFGDRVNDSACQIITQASPRHHRYSTVVSYLSGQGRAILNQIHLASGLAPGLVSSFRDQAVPVSDRMPFS